MLFGWPHGLSSSFPLRYPPHAGRLNTEHITERLGWRALTPNDLRYMLHQQAMRTRISTLPTGFLALLLQQLAHVFRPHLSLSHVPSRRFLPIDLLGWSP
jgi:hypothetical protein